MLDARLLELAVDGGDLAVEVVDHRDRREHTAAPRRGEVQAPRQLAALAAEEIADRTAVPEGQQLGVDAML
jgi:hypothetical protein